MKGLIIQGLNQMVIMPFGNLGMTMGLDPSLVAVRVWDSFILQQESR
jgi:hypothetical protein